MSKMLKSSVMELLLETTTACYFSVQMDISWEKEISAVVSKPETQVGDKQQFTRL